MEKKFAERAKLFETAWSLKIFFNNNKIIKSGLQKNK